MSIYSMQNYEKHEKVYVPPIVMLFSNEKEGEHLKDVRPQ